MADVPHQTLTVRDPGLGVSPEISDTFVFVGTSSKGTINTFGFVNDPAQVVDALGQGPLAEDLCHFLAIAGGPAAYIKTAHVGNEGVVTMGTVVRGSTDNGTCVVAASATDPDGPYDRYETAKIEITKSGALGVAEFRYTLDGSSYSPAMIVPSGGTYLIPNTGLDATFAVAVASPSTPTFAAGTVFPFGTTANHYDVTQVSAALDALVAATDEVAVIVLCGREDTPADGATMHAAVNVYMTTLANGFKFAGLIMDSGVPAMSGAEFNFTTTKTAWVNAISAQSRTAACFSGVTRISQKPFVGWSNIHTSFVGPVAARAGSANLSSHLGRFADSSLPGVTAIDYDEERENQGMSAAKFITPRTWIGARGFYINKDHLRSPNGSDFTNWPRRRIMDVALSVTQKANQPYMNTKVRVLTDGTGRIDPKEAERREGTINNALRDALLSPKDAEGNQGHVAAVRYVIDRNNNVLTSNKVLGRVAIVPDPYSEEISTEIGFAASV